jgi:hypothetical protein
MTALDEALAAACGEREMKPTAPLGLNVIGKPFSPNYDPTYRMKYKPSYAHLRHPYGFSMRFVGDPPPKAENRHRPRRRQPPPAPLLDETSMLRKQLLDAQDRLHQVQRRITREIDRAIKKADGLHQELLALKAAHSADPAAPAASTILEDRIQLDLIRQIELVRDTIEKMDASGMPPAHFQFLADNALRAAVDHVVERRRQHLAKAG